MDDSTESENLIYKALDLSDQLRHLIAPTSSLKQQIEGFSSVDVVITPTAINEFYELGAIVRQLFPDSSMVISVRSSDFWENTGMFGVSELHLSYAGMIRPQIFAKVFDTFWTVPVRRVFCIPQRSDDVLTAIALKELFDLPVCTYWIDSCFLNEEPIPEYLIQELLKKSNLRLASSPEMRDNCEEKYGLKFWLLPPLVSEIFIAPSLIKDQSSHECCTRGALLGPIRRQLWLDLLRQIVPALATEINLLQLNDPDNAQIDCLQPQTSDIGIPISLVDEHSLVAHLQTCSYVIIPTNPLTHTCEDAVEQFNLPLYLILTLATSHTPIIVLGHSNTAAAQFVKRFKVGVVCEYEITSLQNAIAEVCKPENQATMRQNAASRAVLFSNQNITDWIWRSLDKSEPIDDRFENLFPRRPADLVHFIESAVPTDVHGEFIPVYQAIRRLKNKGFNPDFVLDVGASVGIWSYIVSKLLPDARFILIDPLMSSYSEKFKQRLPQKQSNFEFVEVAISNRSGTTTLQVSSDLYGSSLLHPADYRSYQSMRVNVTTLDELAQAKIIQGRGLLKIDVQCAEHLVIEGAKNLIAQVDAIAVELSLVRYDERAKDFAEMIESITQLGFRYYDDIGCWRSPVDGTLLQKDVLFVRNDLYIPETSY